MKSLLSLQLALILSLGLLWTPSLVYANSVVSSSISVSASSGNSAESENQVSVKTIVNGEVTENWTATSTEPIVYNNTSFIDSETNSLDSVSIETDHHSDLIALIKRLEALIKLYVTLTQN